MYIEAQSYAVLLMRHVEASGAGLLRKGDRKPKKKIENQKKRQRTMVDDVRVLFESCWYVHDGWWLRGEPQP